MSQMASKATDGRSILEAAVVCSASGLSSSIYSAILLQPAFWLYIPAKTACIASTSLVYTWYM